MEEQGTYLVTRLSVRGKERIVSAFYENGRASELSCMSSGEQTLLGNIYVGKVKNILSNIGAAFIEIAGGVLCYYSLAENKAPLYTSEKKKPGLMPGDELLVQVSREAVKTKAPTVTCNLNFAGKYLVLTTQNKSLGISSKLDQAERQRLRQIVEPFLQEDFGIIVRTNAAGAEEGELREELARLTALVRRTLETGRNQTCFSLVYREPSAYAARIRSLPKNRFTRIVTDDAGIYDELDAYLNAHQPEDRKKLQLYEQEAPSLNSLYGLAGALEDALRERVWLKSGGYLVIQPTEALTVIDVNTGKYQGRKKQQDTFLKINKEAAAEIARQLRLRNLSGIIIADFIDMEAQEDQKVLMDYLASELKHDPVKTTLVDMTALGLVEITRKKTQKSLSEQVYSD